MHAVTARDDIAGVVLAAGLGTRLRPLTDIRPKPLCPVNHVPLVDGAIAHVRTVTEDVAVNVHHHRQTMEQHLASLGVHVSVEEPAPLGTAGAIGRLRDWIDGRPTIIHNSDAWHVADLRHQLLDGWDGERIRLLVVAPQHGMAPDFADGTVFAGVSLNPWADVADLQPVPTGLWEIRWRQADLDGRIERVSYDGPWFDTGTPTNYLGANLAASGGRSVIAPDATIELDEGDIVRSVVWPGATVRRGERLHEQIRAADAHGRPVTVDAPQPRPPAQDT